MYGNARKTPLTVRNMEGHRWVLLCVAGVSYDQDTFAGTASLRGANISTRHQRQGLTCTSLRHRVLGSRSVSGTKGIAVGSRSSTAKYSMSLSDHRQLLGHGPRLVMVALSLLLIGYLGPVVSCMMVVLLGPVEGTSDNSTSDMWNRVQNIVLSLY